MVLAGRTAELEAFDTLRARVARGSDDRGIVLTGLRGVGKTVLLNEMHRYADQAEWLTVRLEARRDPAGTIAVQRALARDLVVAARRLRRGRLSERFREALATIGAFNLKLGATGVELGVSASRDRANSGDVEVDIIELVEDVSLAMADRGRAFAIFIDEMQDIDAETIGALISAQHIAHQRGWPFYIIAAGLPNLPRVLTESRSYAERLFTYRTVGQLSRIDSTEALRDPAVRLGASFSEAALDQLLDAVDGYPYFIQEYGQAAWDIAAGKEIDADDARAAIRLGTELLDSGFYRSRWERATSAERRLLVAMAVDEDRPSATSAIASRLRVPVSALGPARSKLIAKGLVFSPEYGQLSFTVPGMAAYITRNR